MIRHGYACINMELSRNGIRTGRTMIDRKFKLGGLQLASDISLANAKDLLTILQWNEQHGIRLFRIGSELFPRWNHYRLEDLPSLAIYKIYNTSSVRIVLKFFHYPFSICDIICCHHC